MSKTDRYGSTLDDLRVPRVRFNASILLLLGIVSATAQAEETCNVASEPNHSNLDTNYILGEAEGEAAAMNWQTGLVWKRCREGWSWDGSTCVDNPAEADTANWNDWMNAYIPLSFDVQDNWWTPTHDLIQGDYIPDPSYGPSGIDRLQSGQWRMPYFSELAALNAGCEYAPMINRNAFPNTPNEFFWSASPYASDTAFALSVDFYVGGAIFPYPDRRIAAPIRLVRGGQPFAALASPPWRWVTSNSDTVFDSFTLARSDLDGQAWGGARISGTGNPHFSLDGGNSWLTEAIVKSGDEITVKVSAGMNGSVNEAIFALRSGDTFGSGGSCFNCGDEGTARIETTAHFTVVVGDAPGRCYVDAAAVAGGDNGSNWANAFLDLKSALVEAACEEIWVAEGLYRPYAMLLPGSPTAIERSHSLVIDRPLVLRGGFAGADSGEYPGGETDASQADPLAHPTVLSGDIGSDDMVDGSGITADADDIVSGNSYHVMQIDGSSAHPVDSSTVIDGFTITGGAADGSNADANGGGLYCNAPGSGSVCSPSLSRIDFIGNRAVSDGGGMFSTGTDTGIASPQLQHIRFIGNLAWYGGGLGIHAVNGSGNQTVLRDVVFQRNRAQRSGQSASGGAIYNVNVVATAYLTVTNAEFSGNWANTGGALTNEVGSLGHGNVELVNVTFDGNYVVGGSTGGALYNKVAGNDMGTTPSYFDLSLSHGTFSNNATLNAGGAISSSCAGCAEDTQRYENVIFWGNSSSGESVDVLYKPSSTTSIEFVNSVVQGGCPGGAVCSGALSTDDPLLGVLQDNGGFSASRLPGPGSPAIDNGSCLVIETADQRGMPRPIGVACDIGATEAIQQLLSVTVTGAGSVSADALPTAESGAIVDCTQGGGSCAAYYHAETPPAITLSATPASGWHFLGWDGDCLANGPNPSALVTLDADKSCVARFAADVPEVFASGFEN